MKKEIRIVFLFLSAILLLIASPPAKAQKNMLQVKTTSGKALNYGSVSTLTTTGNTLTHIDSFVIQNNTAGLMEVQVAGRSAAGDGVTGWKAYRYHKASGTLTIDSVTNISPTLTDTGLGSGTFTFAVTAGNNFQLKVRGNTSTTVYWRTKISQFAP